LIKFSKVLLTAALAVGLATGVTTAPVMAGQDQVASVQCTQVWQYVVTANGDMTNAESGGSFVGWAVPGDVFNVRIKGSPRYYGYNVNNAKWGLILSSKLQYNNQTWCE
jgi:hypothetical protein